MYDERVCAYALCDIKFTPSKHNQKYCCSEHGVLENNRKGLEAYHNRKKRVGGPRRVCDTPGCGTLLSVYNDSNICAGCEDKQESARREMLIEVLSGNK